MAVTGKRGLTLKIIENRLSCPEPCPECANKRTKGGGGVGKRCARRVRSEEEEATHARTQRRSLKGVKRAVNE